MPNRFNLNFNAFDEFRKFVNPGKFFNTRKCMVAMRLNQVSLEHVYMELIGK
jgi:hypothetical protein